MASATIGSLRVVLGIDTAIFDKGLADATKSLKGIGKSMQGIGQSMSAYLTAPILGFGALTVKTAGDFEAAMNRVGAATGSTGTEFEALETLARDLGRTTTKSASEAADMLEMLAKNGLDAEQILDGAAAAAIKLSEATGGELSKSADVATNVMAQFGKQAKDLGPIIDQITGVTLASQFGFDDYALALGQAGGVAGSLGVSLTDFNASIAATSDVFNSGYDAGTSFKTFLLRLVPQSEGAADAMEKLGLEFFDSAGKMKSMSAIAQELKEGLSGLSDEARNDALNTIFGQDALRTAIAMGTEGAAGIDAMVQQINKKGIADEQAAARLKGFNGEMEKLAGAFDELKLAIADSGLLETITSFVTKLAEWMTELAKTNPEILKWGTIVAGLTAILGPVVMIIGTLATAIAAIGAPIALAIAGVAALAAGAVALYTNWDQVRTLFPAVAAVVETLGAGLKVLFEGALTQGSLMVTGLTQLLSGDFAGAWETVKSMVGNVATTILNLTDVVFPGFTASLPGIVVSVVQFAAEIVAAFAALPGQMMEIGGQIIDGLWQGIQNKWASVKESVTNIGASVAQSFRDALGIHSPSKVMAEVGTNIMQGLSEGMTGLRPAVVGVAQGVSGDVKVAFKGAESAGNSLASSFSNAFKGVIDGSKSVKEALSDLLGNLADMWMDNAFQAIFGGGVAGNTGGIFGSLFGGLGSLLGFASGGTIMPGGTGGIDSQVVAFRKSPNERVDITKPGQQLSDGGGNVHVTVGVDPKNGSIVPYVDSRIDSAAPGIVSASVSRANQSAPMAVAQYQGQKMGGDYRG